jgi:hypothetical protein
VGPLSSGLACLWLAAAAPAAAEEGESTGAPGRAEGLAIAQAQTAPAPPRTPGHTTAPAPSKGTGPAPSRGTGPAPPQGAAPSRVRPAPPGHPGYYWQDGVWYYDPYFGWAGWGLGWGFYPLYPEPPPPDPGSEPPSPPIVNEVAFWAGPTRQRDSVPPGTLGATGNGSSFGFSYAIDGERFGGFVGGDLLFLAGFDGADSSNTLQLVEFNAAWAPLVGDSGRLRVELGLSLAEWPGALPYGAARSVGPDLGLSGRVMLLGPFGVRGYARVTPFPRLIVDLSAVAALRFGPLALTAGWRDLSLAGDGAIPSLRFAGPQFGVAAAF